MQYAFSDGNIWYEFAVFTLVLAGLIVRGLFPAAKEIMARFSARVAAFVRHRNALPEHTLLADLRKIDLARIMVGGLAAVRYGEILQIAIANGNWSAVTVSASAVVLAFLVTVGLFTPAAVLVLMATGNLLLDNLLGASTLGTMVMSIVLLILFLAPAGRTLSADAWLAGRGGMFAVIPRAMHAISGEPDQDRILTAKVAGLFAYFCVCLYSVSWHLNDEAWMSGLVIAWVLLSPTSNPWYHDFAWQVYEWSPFVYVNFGRLSIAGMFAWYVLVLPGIFMGRWVRGFVIWWGLAFFLISTFVLPLKFLGWYELVFWFVLFAGGAAFGRRDAPTLAVLFDDRCNLCDRTVRTLAYLDLFGRLEYRPIRRNLEFAGAHGVTLEEGLTDLVGVEQETGRRYDGFALYEEIAGRLIVLWPLLPLFWLGRLTGLGRPIYRFIAARRTKLFGVCEFSTIPDRHARAGAPLHLAANKQGFGLTRGFGAVPSALLVSLMVLAAIFLVRLPLGSTEPDLRKPAKWFKEVFGAAPLAFGIHKINVFNTVDLSIFSVSSTYRALVSEIEPGDAYIEMKYTKPFGRPLLLSDEQYYKIAAQMRRVSRMNVGCDADYFDKVIPYIADSLTATFGSAAPKWIVAEILRNPWPSTEKFRQYEVVPRITRTLCQAVINVEERSLHRLYFMQGGVDMAMEAKGYPPVLAHEGVALALDYPCVADAGFINTLADSNDAIRGDRERLDVVRELLHFGVGEFAVDCLVKAYRVVLIEPTLLSLDKTIPGIGNCSAGIALLQKFREAPGLGMLQDRYGVLSERADKAREAKDYRLCLAAALEARSLYWDGILKSGGPNTARVSQ